MSELIGRKPERALKLPRTVQLMATSLLIQPQKTWHAAGCPECSLTGYRGRSGIFEVWRLHEEEADLILKHADEHTLRHLRKQGMSSLLEDD
jgi:type II secretory ATPase GspE/PulE/Tfp pilus assembly ATPase PilB-like protein